MKTVSRQAGIGIAVGLVVVLVLAIAKFLQFQIVMAQQGQAGPPPQAVTTVVAQTQSWFDETEVVGEVAPLRGAELSTQVSGVVTAIHYTPGQNVTKGELLVSLDSTVEKAEVEAARARAKQSKLEFDRMKTLVARHAISRSDFEKATADFEASQAEVESLQAALVRRQVRALFDGTVGIQKVAEGDYVNPGTPLVSLFDTSELYINFTIPERKLNEVKVGNAIKFNVESTTKEDFQATITSIEPQVDTSTRNAAVQARIQNHDGVLRPGMFARVRVLSSKAKDYVTIPLSSIQFAPYGDTVFIVQELEGQDGQLFTGVLPSTVTLGPRKGDAVAITKGVKEGDQVVSSGSFKLFPHAPVVVNNEVSPGDSTDPTPPLT